MSQRPLFIFENDGKRSEMHEMHERSGTVASKKNVYIVDGKYIYIIIFFVVGDFKHLVQKPVTGSVTGSTKAKKRYLNEKNATSCSRVSCTKMGPFLKS